MKVVNIFSKRQKQLRGEVPDVYQYETISNELRVQVIHIWYDAFGEVYRNNFGRLECPYSATEAYRHIHTILCREYGLFRLGEDDDLDFEAVYNFFLETQEAEKVIDVIEVSLQYMAQHDDYMIPDGFSPNDAIDELNYRFREHGIGYQYESGQIIRVDSEFMHSEVVKPALSMLSDPMYEGANDEFLKAHEHYRIVEYKECMNECLKAFESCIKAICTVQGWAYNDGDTISRLIAIVFDKELIPDFMQSHFSGLRGTLESGASTLRNRRSGHGQGSNIITVPEHMAAYTLHLTASNILFLARAYKEIDDDIPF